MRDKASIAVVLPVYAGVHPEHLKRALESVYSQTLLPSEIIVIEDGELTSDQRAVLDGFAGKSIPPFRLKLPVQSGAGPANDAGLRAASTEWIAKVDADDVSVPYRFERQFALSTEGGYDLVGASMHEFDTEEDNIVAIRTMPVTQSAILKRARFNNPVNHPTAFYRRSVAIRVGGYRDVPFMEDYDLIARILAAGGAVQNDPEALVLFRAGDLMLKRRRGLQLIRSEFRMQRNLVDYGLVSGATGLLNFAMRTSFRFLPMGLMRGISRRILAKPVRRRWLGA